MDDKLVIEKESIIELARHLRKEYLFICCEKKYISECNEKVIQRSQSMFHSSWINSKQKLNLEKLASRKVSQNPGDFCLQATALDNVCFIESYKKLSSSHVHFADLIYHLRKDSKLVASILLEAEKVCLPDISSIIPIILSSLYCDCLLPEDRSLVLSLLQQLIYKKIAIDENPRRLLQHGSCAFSQVYKIFSATLRGAKLFLIAALREPVMSLLMEDDQFLDIDPERALTRFTREEKFQQFGKENTEEYNLNLEKHRQSTINKLVNLATKFIDGISNNIFGFPDSLSWLIRHLYIALIDRKSDPIDGKEVGGICSDLIFSHFICHAIVDPELYGIVDTHINHVARFNLMQIAQIIQILGINRWENVEHKYKDVYSRFPPNCVTSILDLIIKDGFHHQSPILNDKPTDVLRTCALITEQDLYQLMDFLHQVNSSCNDHETKSVLTSLLSKIPESVLTKLSASAMESSSTTNTPIKGDGIGNNEESPVNTNINSTRLKKSILNRVSRRRPESEFPPDNVDGISVNSKSQSDFTKIEVLVLNFAYTQDSHNQGLLSEDKVLNSSRRKNRKSKSTPETGSISSSSYDLDGDTRNDTDIFSDLVSNDNDQDLLSLTIDRLSSLTTHQLSDDEPDSSVSQHQSSLLIDFDEPSGNKSNHTSSLINSNDESESFENTKKVLRHVLSCGDHDQTLPHELIIRTSSTSSGANLHTDLVRFLMSLLAEADYMNNSNNKVALQEAIRRIKSYDENNCQKLLRSIREDYQRRSPYIAYLIRCRQSLLSTIAQFDNILAHLRQDKKNINHNLVNLCVRYYLESKESSLKEFIEQFKGTNVSDEKAQLVEEFLFSLFKGMETDSVWQIASEEQVEHGKKLIERHVTSQIYIYALYPNGDGDVLRDQILQQHIDNLSKVITPEHNDLRIPNIYHSECPWPAAQQQIIILNAYKTPREKVDCVIKCCKIIMSLLKLANEKSIPTADDLIPVLVYILIKANPSSLLSNVQYVECFYEKQLKGEPAYWWTQFSSAVGFVKTMDYA